MYITDKRKAATVKFKEIKYGECFVYPEGESICMKICGSDKDNAVDLSTGDAFESCDNIEVIKVNSRLEIW